MTEQVITKRRLGPEAAELLKLGIDRQIESEAKSFGLSQYAQMWLAGMDMPDSISSKPTKPYSQVALVYTCINKLISSIAGLPLVLSTIDEKIIESGPVYDLLFNSPALSWQRFVIETIGHYALSRDVFWIFIEMQGHQPKEILIVSGTQMHPLTHDRTAGGILLGWEFRGIGGQRAKFTLDEVYQWKNFNPYDKFHGLGPVEASQLNINYSFAADLYNASTLANAAEPGAILTTQGKLDSEQMELLRNQFEARHKGAGQAKRTAVLTGGMDIKTVAMTMADMEVAKITEMSDKKICSAFGVPPGVAGLITEAQYSHGPAMRDFIFNTIIPLAALFAGELTYGIISRFYSSDSRAVEPKDSRLYYGHKASLRKKAAFRSAVHKAISAKRKIFAWFDSSQHPTVQEQVREIAEKVLKSTTYGIKLNNIIEAHDLPYEQVSWGDDWWIGMGQVPARFALEAGLEGITGPSLPEGQPEQLAISYNAIIKPYPNEHAARLRNPDDFNPDTFRRTNGGTIYGSIEVPKTIAIIWGKLKGHDAPDDPPIPQALRFPVEHWTVEQAKAWLKDHNIEPILFEPAEESKQQNAKGNEQQRLRIWRNWVISWAGIEREYQEAIRKFFIRQQRILSDKLKKALSEFKTEKADPEQIVARIVFDLKVEDGKIKVINQTFFERASELGIRQSLTELLGLSGEELDKTVDHAKRMPLMRAALLRQARKITGVNRTTQNMVATQLQQGFEVGEDLNQLTRRIKTTLGSNRARALSIARTQTASAVSTGRHSGMKIAGIELKSWVTSGDSDVRDTHRDAGYRYADGIALDLPFEVGGEFLMYPGDPAGSAFNIINCRCLSIARKAGSRNFDLGYYSNLKFYSYFDMVNKKEGKNGT